MPKREKLTPCQKCPLYELKATNFVPGVGNPATAKAMLVGGMSTLADTEAKEPFSDTAGQYVRAYVPEDGEIYATNAVKCWSQGKDPEGGFDRDPPSKAILLCREAYLEKELEEFKGDKIVLLGETATHALQRHSRKLQELIGHPEPLVEGKLAMSVWDPQEFLEKGKHQVLLDIQRAVSWGLR